MRKSSDCGPGFAGLGLAFVLTVALSACVTAPPAQLRKATMADGEHSLVATDSRLRVIASAEQSIFATTGSADPKRIICTEPSPDVATTLVNSLGASLAIPWKGTASLSSQQVEGLVQLGERTAAIQLLRDKMYQTCLAYANGAISATNYSLIMSRLDDTIVTLSLGDGAAGAFGRKLAGIGGESEAQARADISGLPSEIARIDEMTGKLAAANKQVDDAQKALQAHKDTTPEKGKEADYNTNTAALEKALSESKSNRDALLSVLQSTAKSATNAGGKISNLVAGGQIQPKPDAQALQTMQAEFLLTDSNREFITACLVELGLRDQKAKGEEDSLTTILKDRVPKGVVNEENAINAIADYASMVMRSRKTELAKYCTDHLPNVLKAATDNFHIYRVKRASLNADVAMAMSSAEVSRQRVREKELLIETMKFCTEQFKDDADRKNACLDQVLAKPAPAAQGSAGTEGNARGSKPRKDAKKGSRDSTHPASPQ